MYIPIDVLLSQLRPQVITLRPNSLGLWETRTVDCGPAKYFYVRRARYTYENVEYTARVKVTFATSDQVTGLESFINEAMTLRFDNKFCRYMLTVDKLADASHTASQVDVEIFVSDAEIRDNNVSVIDGTFQLIGVKSGVSVPVVNKSGEHLDTHVLGNVTIQNVKDEGEQDVPLLVTAVNAVGDNFSTSIDAQGIVLETNVVNKAGQNLNVNLAASALTELPVVNKAGTSIKSYAAQTTNAPTAVSFTAEQSGILLAANPNRKRCIIFLSGGTSSPYIKFGNGDASTTGSMSRLSTASPYFNCDYYTGAIYAFSYAGTSTLQCLEIE
jgi:hypothetical protein